MRKFCLFLTLILFSLSAFTLLSCSDNGSSLDCYYFKTGIHIETHDFSMSENTENSLRRLFSDLEKEFDAKNTDSVVYAFNSGSANDEFTLSAHGVNILAEAKNLYSYTDKLFDPSVYTLVKLWHFAPVYPVEFTPPTDALIAETLSTVDFESVSLDANSQTITKTKENVSLDFGGIVKGYAADKAAEILKSAGHKSGYISVGGSSLYLLSVESLSIIHPRKSTEGKSIISVNLKGEKNLSVSTSGDYEKSYVYGGKTFSHLINPKTGYPTDTGVCSVTVIGADGTFSDAVTTAACLKEHLSNDLENSPLKEFLLKILTDYPRASVYAIYDDGLTKQILTNKEQGKDFTLLDTEYSVRKI